MLNFSGLLNVDEKTRQLKHYVYSWCIKRESSLISTLFSFSPHAKPYRTKLWIRNTKCWKRSGSMPRCEQQDSFNEKVEYMLEVTASFLIFVPHQKKVWLEHCTNVSPINRLHWWMVQKFRLFILQMHFIRIQNMSFCMPTLTNAHTHTNANTVKIPIVGFI